MRALVRAGFGALWLRATPSGRIPVIPAVANDASPIGIAATFDCGTPLSLPKSPPAYRVFSLGNSVQIARPFAPALGERWGAWRGGGAWAMSTYFTSDARRMTVSRIDALADAQILYSDPAQADGWLKRPNRAFGDHTPLERMAAGDVTDLAAVRAYLDAARAPWS